MNSDRRGRSKVCLGWILCLVCLLSASLLRASDSVPLFRTSKEWQSWSVRQVTDSGDKASANVQVDHGGISFPVAIGSNILLSDVPVHYWSGHDTLRLHLGFDGHQSEWVGVRLAISDVDTQFIENKRLWLIRSGRDKVINVDLRPYNRTWLSGSQRVPWDGYVTHFVRQIKLTVYAYKQGGVLRIKDLSLQDPVVEHDRTAGRNQLVADGPSALGVGDTFSAKFRLARIFAQPFDAANADVSACIISPDGSAFTRPCFLSRDYELVDSDGGEQIVPQGGYHWAFRFTPAQQGVFSWIIEVDGERVPGLGGTFEVYGGDPGKAFVQVSKRDSRYFELSNGKFFYPIGMNYCYPFDAGQGVRDDLMAYNRPLAIYSDFFASLARAGGNTVQLWMTPFWLSLQWKDFYNGYGGTQFLNGSNAWKMDYLLSQADHYQLKVLVSLMTRHQFMQEENKSAWQDNPYALANGGPLKSPTDFFADGKARDAYRNLLRYVMARWGHDPTVFGFNLLNEADTVLAGNTKIVPRVLFKDFKKQQVAPQTAVTLDWLDEMTSYAKSIYPERLVTVSNCQGRGLVAKQLYNSKSVPALFTNYYPYAGRVMSSGLAQTWNELRGFNKPVLITETGARSSGDSMREAKAGSHCALWAASMLPLSGSGFYWWWNKVHNNNLYDSFGAVNRFWAGVDRRGRKLLGSRLQVLSPVDSQEQFVVRALSNGREYYAWISPQYEGRFFVPKPDAVSGLKFVVPGLESGEYRYEFWDCRRGKIVNSGILSSADQELYVPRFYRDIALKVYPHDGKPFQRLEGNVAAPEVKNSTLTVQSWPLEKVATTEVMAKEIIKAKPETTKRPWDRIDDAFNPYTGTVAQNNLYEGVIYCPMDGLYQFATESDDASFLWVDGQLVTSWPGEHYPKNPVPQQTEWEHRGSLKLTQGHHRFRYLHQNNKGEMLARAGWRIPCDTHIRIIPARAFYLAPAGDR